MNDEDLISRSRRLQQEITPETDLWAGIENEISATSYFPKFSMAVAATLVLGVSLFLWQTNTPGSVDRIEPQMASTQFQDEEFRLMKAELIVGYEKELKNVSPETRKVVEKNMATIALAISEIDAALASDPDNYLLQRMLATTYTNELKLLQETQLLSYSAGQRTEI